MSTSPTSWIEPILERYERPLIQYALSICSDSESARDVVQDTFVRLARNGALDAGRLAPWLFTVCRNRAIDWKRKHARLVVLEEDEPLHIPSDEPDPSARLEAKESAARLMKLLARLPEQQREALRLRFQCDLSYREISEIMQLSESNVGFILHTGIKTLRQLMT